MELLAKLFVLLYQWMLAPLMTASLPILALFMPKIREGLNARRGQWERLQQSVAMLKPGSRVLFHVASVGEYLQAKPVIEELRTLKPDLQICLSYYSPSLGKWLGSKSSGADLFFPLPSDRESDVNRLLELLEPAALVLCKFDLWPNLILCSAAKHLRIFLVAATLQPKSRRYSSHLGRSFYGLLYQKIHRIFAVSQNDAERFKNCYPPHKGIVVAGDTRVDSVANRKASDQSKTLDALSIAVSALGRIKLVIGSCWPSDEELLTQALAQLDNSTRSKIFSLWVPHEIDPGHLDSLELRLKTAGLKTNRWSTLNLAQNTTIFNINQKLDSIDGLIVDKLGLLATLYKVGQLAFVGAGPGGLHNIMEPAIWGLPVLFGPRFHNAPEAYELIARGAARSCKTSHEAAEELKLLINAPDLAANKGKIGQKFLENQLGSARYCAAEIVLELPKNSSL